MRRFGRPIVVTGAAVALLALGPATMGTAGTASPPSSGPAVPEAISHGCPGGHVCLYDSQSAFKKAKPTVTDTDVPGLHSGGVPHNVVVVNNTIRYYASQGTFQPRYIKYHEFCWYVPDPKDEQSPNRIEDPADGASVTAIASGTQEVDGPFPVSLNYCTGSA